MNVGREGAIHVGSVGGGRRRREAVLDRLLFRAWLSCDVGGREGHCDLRLGWSGVRLTGRPERTKRTNLTDKGFGGVSV